MTRYIHDSQTRPDAITILRRAQLVHQASNTLYIALNLEDLYRDAVLELCESLLFFCNDRLNCKLQLAACHPFRTDLPD